MPVYTSLSELCQWVESLKAQGKAVVTTNGCFDLMHVGHLRYLQAAKAQGDVLIVLVNSDASVQRLKGPKRPLVQEAERAELLAALRCVDGVAIFEEDTPSVWLEALKPTIHVKGAQYSAESLPEAPLLESLGTQLVFVSMVAGRSTTQLIDKIKQAEGFSATTAPEFGC